MQILETSPCPQKYYTKLPVIKYLYGSAWLFTVCYRIKFQLASMGALALGGGSKNSNDFLINFLAISGDSKHFSWAGLWLSFGQAGLGLDLGCVWAWAGLCACAGLVLCWVWAQARNRLGAGLARAGLRLGSGCGQSRLGGARLCSDWA